MRSAAGLTLAALWLAGSFSVNAATATGTLYVEVERLQSEVPLSKTQREDVRFGGITWGVQGNELILVQVDPRFVDYDYGFTTRYGYSHAVQLPAGDYRLTVVGLEPRQSYSAEKQMNSAAFLNQGVRTVTIEADKTTSMRLAPVVLDEDALKPFVPTLLTVLTAPGQPIGEAEKTQRAVPVSLRDARSVAWPDYHGPLKFIPR